MDKTNSILFLGTKTSCAINSAKTTARNQAIQRTNSDDYVHVNFPLFRLERLHKKEDIEKVHQEELDRLFSNLLKSDKSKKPLLIDDFSNFFRFSPQHAKWLLSANKSADGFIIACSESVNQEHLDYFDNLLLGQTDNEDDFFYNRRYSLQPGEFIRLNLNPIKLPATS